MWVYQIPQLEETAQLQFFSFSANVSKYKISHPTSFTISVKYNFCQTCFNDFNVRLI